MIDCNPYFQRPRTVSNYSITTESELSIDKNTEVTESYNDIIFNSERSHFIKQLHKKIEVNNCNDFPKLGRPPIPQLDFVQRLKRGLIKARTNIQFKYSNKVRNYAFVSPVIVKRNSISELRRKIMIKKKSRKNSSLPYVRGQTCDIVLDNYSQCRLKAASTKIMNDYFPDQLHTRIKERKNLNNRPSSVEILRETNNAPYKLAN